jgi:hypothetical protein
MGILSASTCSGASNAPEMASIARPWPKPFYIRSKAKFGERIEMFEEIGTGAGRFDLFVKFARFSRLLQPHRRSNDRLPWLGHKIRTF